MRRLVLVEGIFQHTSAKHRTAFWGSRPKSKNWPICKSEGEHLRNLKGCSFRYVWTQRNRDLLKLVRADRVSKYCAAWLYIVYYRRSRTVRQATEVMFRLRIFCQQLLLIFRHKLQTCFFLSPTFTWSTQRLSFLVHDNAYGFWYPFFSRYI